MVEVGGNRKNVQMKFNEADKDTTQINVFGFTVRILLFRLYTQT